MADQLTPIQETELTGLLEKQEITENYGHGLSWPRLFGNGDPYAGINWEVRTAKIVKGDGQVVFEQKDVEVPDFWSQTATDIVASKYFRGKYGSPEREHSARQIVDRVGDALSAWGLKDGYFKTHQDYENFRDDLKYLLINQYGAFNSPVWFNVGVRERPQSSACFILAVEDNMQSILDWYRDEGWIFKFGSGSGANLSKLRSSGEPLSLGGYSSGPVSFMKGADGIANSIRSGGETRRAAKMVILNADHPDIKSFIYCKKYIEDMTKVLEASGIKASIDGELFNPYTLLPYQNANNSVRVPDEFMQRVETDDNWDLKAVIGGKTVERLKAREVMDWISDAAWHSADPGMQFDTIINDWHTVPNSGRINASNPCSEYMSLDNSACNLASINLLKFLNADGSFDIDSYKKAINVFITAQEIIVGNSSYPTEKIGQNAVDFRQLGLGYANLGSLLMSMGLAYDSDEGRNIAAAVTSILTGEGYLMSAKIASIRGPFAGYEKNRESMLRVIRKHLAAAENLSSAFKQMSLPLGGNGFAGGFDHQETGHETGTWREVMMTESLNVWQEALAWGEKYGYRNSQATVLAPTGTIAFLMDCQTTGIEPDLALVKYKKLVGGGVLKLVNNHVPAALARLNYSQEEIQNIANYIIDKETIEGAPAIKEEDLPVFDCSFKAKNGVRSINYMGHIRMMGAVQPFISGAISKTVNLPADATVDDIKDAFMQAWRHGLKAIAVYRDGCKSVQPLNTSADDKKRIERIDGYTRVKLPAERNSITHRFSVNNHKGYLTVGLYPETNKPGETFITIAKEGSTLSGLFDVIATLTSICLQSGVPLKSLVQYFKDSRFEPSGFTSNPEIPFAKSFVDYIFRYMGNRFLNEKDREEIFGHANGGVKNGDFELNGLNGNNTPLTKTKTEEIKPVATTANWDESAKNAGTDAPPCEKCGSMMFRAGSCFSCPNCFNTTGVCN
ncbi:MAG: vitamin B12-dependent ribonucleotide reductase [Minisyncoccia bacterium]